MRLMPQYSWPIDEFRPVQSKRNSGNLILECSQCGVKFYRRKWYHELLMSKNDRAKIFCSPRCSLIGKHPTQETVDKIKATQTHVSKPKSGRKGHIVTQETREKIRRKKIGVPHPADHAIILTELAFRGTHKFAVTKGLVPDAIFIEDGKLVALELQKCKWETDVRKKMMAYDNRTDYDKVIIVWYSPTGKRLKEWHKDNGEWTRVTK